MVRPVDPATLAAVGGQTTAKAAGDFASTMMNLYQIKKQGELQDMQMNQMKQQQEEWKANEEQRNLERQRNMLMLNQEIERLPDEHKLTVQENLNKSMALETQQFDLALTDLATVRGAKGYKSWQKKHKDSLAKYFDSDEEFQEFLKQPFTVQGKDTMLRTWRANKPEMIDKRLEYDMQIEVARAKADAEADDVKKQHSMPSVKDLTNLFADSGMDADLRSDAAMVTRDLIDISKNKDFPMRISAPMATTLVKIWAEEIDSDNYFWETPPPGAMMRKQQQFIQDLANGKADYYVSAALNIPMDTISKIREDYPHLSTKEIYSQLDDNARSK